MKHNTDTTRSAPVANPHSELIAELWEVYELELKLQFGFGAPSEWSKGPRSFAAFCATRNADKALASS